MEQERSSPGRNRLRHHIDQYVIRKMYKEWLLLWNVVISVIRPFAPQRKRFCEGQYAASSESITSPGKYRLAVWSLGLLAGDTIVAITATARLFIIILNRNRLHLNITSKGQSVASPMYHRVW